jgi:hypothetical protein
MIKAEPQRARSGLRQQEFLIERLENSLEREQIIAIVVNQQNLGSFRWKLFGGLHSEG